MDKAQLVKQLMATFLEELDEHVQALNRDLLALKKDPEGPARAERCRGLFRTAHSLKGAARSVNARALEDAWSDHRLEVRRLHEKLFYRPLLEAVARVPTAGSRLTAEAAGERLAALGYADPQAALRHLDRQCALCRESRAGRGLPARAKCGHPLDGARRGDVWSPALLD